MLRTFGQLSLQESAFKRLKPLLLLAYLAVEGRQDRRALAALFWPDSDDPLNSLSVSLSRLRGARRGCLTGNRYTVEAVLETDVEKFLRAAELGEHETALGLYEGSFLEGVALPGVGVALENWLYLTRESLAARACGSLLALAEQRMATGECDLAAHYAETAYALPAAPPAGVEKLRRMHRLLSAGGSAVADAVEAEAAEVGAVRSDVSGSGAPVSKSALVPPATREQPEATPGNVPRAPTSFIGRQTELRRLAAQLGDPHCRLLSLVGPGGVGKSRLALRLAREELARRRWAGVYLVPLVSLQTAELLPASIAEALGLSLKGREPPLDLVKRFVNDKRLLLVLDNAEHLDSADIVKTLLDSCPNLTVLVTSRIRLNLQVEWAMTLGGLSHPTHADASLEDLLTYSAPELFYRRAKRSRLSLTLTQEDARHLAELCRLLEGSPLALELAAPWLRALPLPDIVQRLERGSELLVDTHKDTDDRHKSISAVFEHSWTLLTLEEQTVLAALSVFEGGFAHDAAAQVADASLFMLTRLIDRSLLRREPEGRYGFHPLTQQFARRKLEGNKPQLGQARDRHAENFLKLAETAEPELQGAEQAVWFDKLENELDNLRAAARFLLEPSSEQKLLRLVSALSRFWLIRGYITEARQWMTRALGLNDPERQASGQLSTRKLRATVLRLAGDLASFQGEFEVAHNYLREGLGIAEALGEETEIAAYHNVLGNLARDQGDFVGSRGHHERGLALNEKLQDFKGMASSLNNLGLVAYNAGDWSLAQRYHERSLELRKKVGDKRGATTPLNNLGNVAYKQGNYAEAERYYQESFALSEALGDQRGTAHALNNLGLTASQRGNYAAAQTYAERSLAIKRTLGEQYSIALSLMNLAHVVLQQKDFPEAEKLLGEALLIMEQLGHNLGTATALHSLGALAGEQGQGGCKAEAYLSAALERWSALPGAYPAYSFEEFGHLAYASHDYERAVKLWARASALRACAGEPLPRSGRLKLEKNLGAVRESLCPSVYQAAWAAGEAMTLEEAVSYALADDCSTEIL